MEQNPDYKSLNHLVTPAIEIRGTKAPRDVKPHGDFCSLCIWQPTGLRV